MNLRVFIFIVRDSTVLKDIDPKIIKKLSGNKYSFRRANRSDCYVIIHIENEELYSYLQSKLYNINILKSIDNREHSED